MYKFKVGDVVKVINKYNSYYNNTGIVETIKNTQFINVRLFLHDNLKCFLNKEIELVIYGDDYDIKPREGHKAYQELQEFRMCSCSTFDLVNFGCKCGGI